MDELTVEEQDLFKKTFKILDTENEGAITSKELGLAIRALGRQPKEAEVQSLINEVDSDGNGTISAAEFYNVILRKMRDTSKEEELRDSFNVFDRENNGYISATELRAVFMALGEKLEDDELEEMIREYDVDQDNHINFEEFTNMMTTR